MDADGLALVSSVSFGLAAAVANLPLAAGQRVVLIDEDFPSDVYAWRTAASRSSAEVVTVPRGRSWTEGLLEAVDERTAVVCAPACHWTDGSRVDLVAVAARAREVGAALVVDASQSLGAAPLDVAAVSPDFLVSVGYKWLLGPHGLGYLWVHPRWRGGVPVEESWTARVGAKDFSRLVDYAEEYRPGARRFDLGQHGRFLQVPMALAALEQLSTWGVASVAEHTAPLTAAVEERALAAGLRPVPAAERLAHIVGVRVPGGITADLTDRLRAADVHLSVRSDSLRISPHLYNDLDDVDRLFGALGFGG